MKTPSYYQDILDIVKEPETAPSGRAETQKFRLAIFMGCLVYLCWGWLTPIMSPQVKDPMWIRYVVSTGILIGLAKSFFSKKPYDTLTAVVIFIGFSMTIQAMYQISINSFHMMTIVGYFIFFAVYLTYIQSRKLLSYYLAFCLSINVALFFFTPAKAYQNFLFLTVGNLAIALAGAVSKFLQLRIMNRLQASEIQKSLVFSNIMDGIAMHDRQGKIIYCNPALSTILGIPATELLHKNPFDANWNCVDSSGSRIPVQNLPLNVALKDRVPVTDFVIGLMTDQNEMKWLSIKAIPIFRSQKDQVLMGVLTTYQDITELKKSHDLNIQQSAQLVEASKLQTLGEMAAGVAHEINNPLTIILAKSHQLKAKLQSQPEEIKNLVSIIENTAHRISKVVKGLNFYARNAETDPYEITNLKMIVDNTLSLCHEKLTKEQITVVIDVPDYIHIQCRPVQISQVLLNLIQNAADAQEGMTEKRICIEAKERHSTIELKVWDYGCGIHKDISEKIMNPFFSTKGVGKGTGLGLSISSGIIENHGGKLKLVRNSSPTIFQATFPAQHPPDIHPKDVQL